MGSQEMDSQQMGSQEMDNQQMKATRSRIEAIQIHGGQEEIEGLQGLDYNLFKRPRSQKSSR